MSVELIRDLLKIDQTIGKDQIQALVEGEILLPDNKPQINKILTIDGDIRVTEVRVLQDKVLVSGDIDLKVLYSADDEKQPVHSIKATTDFEEEIEIEGVTEGMTANIRAHIEHIDYRLLENNKISIKTVVGLEGKVQTESSIDIIKDIRGNDGIQVLKETIKYDDVIGLNTSSTIVKEAFEIDDDLPDIVDILRVDTKVYEKENNIVDDRVIVAGTVEYSIMYFGDDEDNKINYLKHEVPFTHFVEVHGASKEMMCTVRLNTGEVSYDVKEDINGNLRIIDVESIIDIEAKVYMQSEKEITVDTYSTTKKVDVKKQELDIIENIGHNTSREVINGIVDVSEENESIGHVYNINVKPILTDYRIIEEKVGTEGFLDVEMLYLEENNNEIKNIKQEIPFKSYVDIGGIEEGMDTDIDIVLDDVRFNKINQHEVEVTTTIKADVTVNRVKKISIITEAQELEEYIDKSNRASITVYIVQNGDTIWDIAKRYNTTVEELIKTNEIINPENIMPGEKLIIEKNVEFEI